MLAHPHGRRVGLLDLDGVASLGDGRVLGEHGDRSGSDDEVAHEALVVLEVAGDPDGAVEEHEHRERSADALGANDVERDGAAIDRKLALCDLDARDVHRCLVLQAGDNRPGLVAGQLPERAAVLIELPEKRARAAVDRAILGRIERRAVDHACHGSSFLLIGELSVCSAGQRRLCGGQPALARAPLSLPLAGSGSVPAPAAMSASRCRARSDGLPGSV